MHELAVMQAVIERIESVLAAGVAGPTPPRILAVRLEVGALAGVVPDALRFCFDLCTRDTALDGAALEIVEIAARARCRTCDGDVGVDGPLTICPCGSLDLEWLAGAELRVRDIEVA
jgi:hydrogenase nickel incorporation protein HypA/HybF